MKRTSLMFLAVAAAAVIAALLFVTEQRTLLEDGTVLARVGSHELRLQVADEPAEMTLGLGGRAGLERGTGMLFVFPSDGRHGIWMKDMQFALDILWLDAEGMVVYLEERVSPATYPNIFMPDTDARYVVELSGGTVRELGVELGTQFDF